MTWWAILLIAYAVLATAEIGWLYWDYHRKTEQENSPRVDSSGDWVPEGANAPSPFDSQTLGEVPHPYLGEVRP